MADESRDIGELLSGIKEALVLRQGDTLVVNLGRDVSLAEFETFRERISAEVKKKMPDVEVLVVGGIEQIAVHRPDAAADDIQRAVDEATANPGKVVEA